MAVDLRQHEGHELGQSLVDPRCVILKVHFVIEGEVTQRMRTLDRYAVRMMLEMLVLKMFLQRSAAVERFRAGLQEQTRVPQAEYALCGQALHSERG